MKSTAGLLPFVPADLHALDTRNSDQYKVRTDAAPMRGGVIMELLRRVNPRQLRYLNCTPVITQHVKSSDHAVPAFVFHAAVLCRVRDFLALDWLWRRLFGDEAWNAAADGVDDSSFFTNGGMAGSGARGWPDEREAPRPPITVEADKTSGVAPGFVGLDADGRRYLFTLDDPGYPELGSSVSVIGAGVLAALGYNVPPQFVVTIEGTGEPRFDGHRAVASLEVEGAVGHWVFDWFRYRREVRGLRMACAWINDVDRVPNNTVVVLRDGRATYYLVDFNSCLGAWQGRPKAPWRGRRYFSSVLWPLARVLSLGLWPAGRPPNQPVVSPAVGRFDADFDPLRWRSVLPNTAFDRMTPSDLRWIASRIATVDRRRIEALIERARFSDPTDAAYVRDVLMQRRQKILDAAASIAPTPPGG